MQTNLGEAFYQYCKLYLKVAYGSFQMAALQQPYYEKTKTKHIHTLFHLNPDNKVALKLIPRNF